MLTKQCLLDFNEWFLCSDYREEIAKLINLKIGDSILSSFYKLPAIMRTTLVIEFAESRGYYLNALSYGSIWSAICNNALLRKHPSRSSAIYASISEFNKLYNQ